MPSVVAWVEWLERLAAVVKVANAGAKDGNLQWERIAYDILTSLQMRGRVSIYLEVRALCLEVSVIPRARNLCLLSGQAGQEHPISFP